MSKHEPQEKEFSFKDYFVPFTTLKAIHFIAIIGLLVFFNSLFNPFVLEDRSQIVRNPSIHSLVNIPNLFINPIGGQETITYYRPILFTAYAVLYSLFQENTFPYHFIQVLLHIANSILVFLIFKKFINEKISFFLALVFLVHPINEETVAWITNLQEVLYLFFGLLGLYLLQINNEAKKYIIFANTSLLLSFLSKETGILFITFGVLYVYFFKRTKLILHASLSFIVCLIYAALRFASHTSFEKEALVPIMKLSFIERMLNVPAIIFYYIKTLFFPKDLVIYHSWVIRDMTFNSFFFPLIIDISFFLVLGMLCLYIFRKSKERKPLLFFVSWFIIGFAFHWQMLKLDFTVADHFFNFAFIALLGIIGMFIQAIKIRKKLIPVVLLISIILIVVLSIRTMIRNTNWQSQGILLSHDVAVAPNDYLLELIYTTELVRDNKSDEAMPHIQKAISLYPESSRAWNTLGAIYYNKKDIPHAKEAFLRSMSIDNYFGTYENYGKLIKEHDSPQKARDFLRKATAIFPNSPILWRYRFIVEYKMGNHDEALLSAKYYYFLKGDEESYAIYNHVLNKTPIKIE
jgi:tetratricopeptide (TPR) repeat protein